jgi:hypothetical protein
VTRNTGKFPSGEQELMTGMIRLRDASDTLRAAMGLALEAHAYSLGVYIRQTER